jgi:glycosyltransferase involved in cell wall biosynthesis
MAVKYSVVIPAFNAGGFIKRTIDSVLAQTYSDYEVIVVDDGSTDNTAEIVKNYSDNVRYIYQDNAGDGPARNTGIRAAKYDWIAFLDHDDEWLAQKMQLQMELLDRNPDLKWCAANFLKQCGKRSELAEDALKMEKWLQGKEYFTDFFAILTKSKCNFMTSTMVIARSLFEAAGMFDSCWLRGADQDMWWRIAYRYPVIGYLSQPLALLHVDPQDVTSTKLRMAVKRGEDARKLIARHLVLAKEQGMLEEFKPMAKRTLRKCLLTTVYHGFKDDSRMTIKQFSEFFPWYWRSATYILTIFPRVTSSILQGLAYVRYRLGFERQVSRRWICKSKTDSNL